MHEQPEPPQGFHEQVHEPAAGPLAPEISRRVGTVLDAVEAEAARLRAESRAEAARCIEQARRDAAAMLAERRARIEALSGELVAKSEAVVARLGDAEPLQRGFDDLVRSLASAAEQLAREERLHA
jgi:hypothetical protein